MNSTFLEHLFAQKSYKLSVSVLTTIAILLKKKTTKKKNKKTETISSEGDFA